MKLVLYVPIGPGYWVPGYWDMKTKCVRQRTFQKCIYCNLYWAVVIWVLAQ